MDKLYTYSYNLPTGKVKVWEDPVIRETELTVTIKNCIGQEVRYRKAELGKIDFLHIMRLDRQDMPYYLRILIEQQRHSIMTLIGMIHNEAKRLEMMDEMLEEAEKDV